MINLWNLVISIHSTARVETKIPGIGADFIPFQSTPPRGWRLAGSPTDLFPLKISIHSTARVETQGCSRRGAQSGFQSTPPRGWRQAVVVTDTDLQKFQSTPPRGWRPRFMWRQPIWFNFNPLHREGGDGEEPAGILDGYKFQSTPPRGWRLHDLAG